MLNGLQATVGHVVVDEAQDLSALALSAVARRCPSGSLTILGDLAQSTGPAGQSSWDDVVANLGAVGSARVEHLTIGYRCRAHPGRGQPPPAVHGRRVPASRSVRQEGHPAGRPPFDRPGRSGSRGGGGAAPPPSPDRCHRRLPVACPARRGPRRGRAARRRTRPTARRRRGPRLRLRGGQGVGARRRRRARAHRGPRRLRAGCPSRLRRADPSRPGADDRLRRRAAGGPAVGAPATVPA